MCGPTTTNIWNISPASAPDAMAMVTKTARKRRLTFATDVSQVTVLSLEDYTQEEKANCWWSSSEHKGFIKSAKDTMREARIFQRQLITNIEDAYKTAQLLAIRQDYKGFKGLLRDPSQHSAKLEEWAVHANGCRGLEKHISTFQRQTRKSGAFYIRSMVIEGERMGIRDVEIAEVYTEQARTYSLYARMVGEADYRGAYSV
jgi:hypothetical protein